MPGEAIRRKEYTNKKKKDSRYNIENYTVEMPYLFMSHGIGL